MRIDTDDFGVSRKGAKPEIWSYGHRNIQSAAIDPQTGQLRTVEHGARGGGWSTVKSRAGGTLRFGNRLALLVTTHEFPKTRSKGFKFEGEESKTFLTTVTTVCEQYPPVLLDNDCADIIK
jgi:carbamoylphosphate synthase large subunit